MKYLLLVNEYIKYAYYLLGLILFITLIKLLVTIKPLKKTIEEIVTLSNDTKIKIDEINKKIEKVQYTIDNSLPLFQFLLFIIIVIIAAIKDYSNTKASKRSLIKSSYKQYGDMKKKFNFKGNKKGRKEFINHLKATR